VSQGGSLFVDIPSDFGTSVTHRCSNSQNCFHDITISTGSLLEEISEIDHGQTNSNHHQAVNQLGNGLIATSISEDGIIESIEWEDPDNKSFFIGVQWHPERMDTENNLSLPIAKYFINKSAQFHSKK